MITIGIPVIFIGAVFFFTLGNAIGMETTKKHWEDICNNAEKIWRDAYLSECKRTNELRKELKKEKGGEG